MKDPVKLCGKATIIAVSIIFALAIIGDVIGSTAAHYICYGSCGAVCSDRNAVFCPTCGSKLSQTVKCSDCGKELPAYTKFCPYCGKRIHYKDDTENKE